MMNSSIIGFDKKMRIFSQRGCYVKKTTLKSSLSIARTSFHRKKFLAKFSLNTAKKNEKIEHSTLGIPFDKISTSKTIFTNRHYFSWVSNQ